MDKDSSQRRAPTESLISDQDLYTALTSQPSMIVDTDRFVLLALKILQLYRDDCQENIFIFCNYYSLKAVLMKNRFFIDCLMMNWMRNQMTWLLHLQASRVYSLNQEAEEEVVERDWVSHQEDQPTTGREGLKKSQELLEMIEDVLN
jgi:hypothetical protein